MHRTQLYLDDALWDALRARAMIEKSTVPELLRRAARDHYLEGAKQRKQAMRDFAGSCPGFANNVDSTEYIRGLRRSSRVKRIRKS